MLRTANHISEVIAVNKHNTAAAGMCYSRYQAIIEVIREHEKE